MTYKKPTYFEAALMYNKIIKIKELCAIQLEKEADKPKAIEKIFEEYNIFKILPKTLKTKNELEYFIRNSPELREQLSKAINANYIEVFNPGISKISTNGEILKEVLSHIKDDGGNFRLHVDRTILNDHPGIIKCNKLFKDDLDIYLIIPTLNKHGFNLELTPELTYHDYYTLAENFIHVIPEFNGVNFDYCIEYTGGVSHIPPDYMNYCAE